MIIAVDFDGTIVENEYPAIGALRKGFQDTLLIDDLIRWKKSGTKLILWTCRCGRRLEQAVEFCRENGLEFDAINDDVESVKKLWNVDEDGCSKKVFANIYIDDRALNPDIENFLKSLGL